MKISRIINGKTQSLVGLIDNQYLVTIDGKEQVFNNFFDAKYIFDNGFDKEEVENGNQEETTKEKRSKKQGKKSKRAKGSRGVPATDGGSSISASDFSEES